MNKSVVAIVDYGLGNVRSLANAIVKTGGAALLTRKKSEILNAKAIILPGVGAFSLGMENLKKFNLDEIIFEFIKTGKPVLGICLGMQMLMEVGEEHEISKGLGLIEGRVTKLVLPRGSTLRLPYIGWNTLLPPKNKTGKDLLLSGINSEQSFYFVHSFVVRPKNIQDVLAETHYGDCSFVSALQKENILGFQCHPEKSGPAGLAIIKNFLNRC